MDQWLWCLNCERCFLGEEPTDQPWAECGYEDCLGSPLGPWLWHKYRKVICAEPEVPEVDKVYPLNLPRRYVW